MARTIRETVSELCLAFPETEEVVSHGHPNFRVRGKTFASFAVNHHGDGRVALSVNAPPGAQQLHTEMEPLHYFVPPYVGGKGWLGMELNQGLDWVTIATRVREAWEKVAPAALAASLSETPRVQPPDQVMTPEQINPFLGARARDVMSRLEEICTGLPETSAATQFGSPVWKAGKKTFVSSGYGGGRLRLQFWVGGDQQSLLVNDPRYSIPAYIGGNGWINLDVEEYADWEEIRALVLQSYGHFALKRMLKALAEGV